MKLKKELWTNKTELPKSEEIDKLIDIDINIIKKHEPEVDGYYFLHGVAIVFYEGLFFASWAHNKGEENTDTEVVQYCISNDKGKNWSKVSMLASGEKGVGVSHGAFLVHEEKLWAFLPHFKGLRRDPQTYLYGFDETNNTWKIYGKISDDFFWPLAEPVLMKNGNYIMAGISVKGDWGSTENEAAVAISNGTDIKRWDIKIIPKEKELVIWGESAVIVTDNEIVNISRGFKDNAIAMISSSNDYGVTWTKAVKSNLKMTDSKPYGGVLSTGERYLVCTNTADCGIERYPLTILISDKDGDEFKKAYIIREGMRKDLGDECIQLLSYPYCIEKDGILYVAYSAGGKLNYNAAEIAAIPIKSLI